jgi:sugar phosphate isomerase/epimerase
MRRSVMARNRQPNQVNRREWLKAACGALALAPAIASAKDRIREKAKKNIKLAIFGRTYSALPLEQAAQKIKADGFHGVILDFDYADVHFDPLAPDWGAAEKITECFGRHGIKIGGLASYYNVVDPDIARRERGEKHMQVMIANWKRLGSPIIATGSGSLNPKSEWLESPENGTENAYLQCRSNLEKLVKQAEKTGAMLAIEPYWHNVIDSVERAERLFREVNSPSLKLVMDPCNYFRKEDLPKMQPMLEDIFRRLGRRIVLAHGKDVKAAANGTDLPAAGLGVLDYPLFLRLLAQLNREIYLVVEHLKLEDVPRVRDFVLSQFERV